MKPKRFYLLLLLVITFSAQAQETAYEGKFEADSYWTTFEGDWSIVSEGDKFFIQLADNFEAKKAPDLKIFFSKLPYDKINGKNAADQSSSALIYELKKYKGALRVEIPASINPADYQSIIVHCEKYSKLWGGADLK